MFSFYDTGYPNIMGVLNITPDSFYENSRFKDILDAVVKAKEMIKDGAVILDIGGESSRPGSEPISEKEELNRVLPIIKELKKYNFFISVDTYHPETARACLENKVDMINDISGFRNSEMIELVVKYKPYIVIMHMKGEPKTMQKNPFYENVCEEVYGYLLETAQKINNKGLPEEKIIIDPGIGFGKRYIDNINLIKNLEYLTSKKYKVLIGASRKSFLNVIINETPENRLEGTLAVSDLCFRKKVDIVRVHDVAEHSRFFKVLKELYEERE